jgi:hypothetical protein
LRKELREEESKGEVEEKKPLKIQIRPPQVSPPPGPLKTQREELSGASSLVEERPKKRHHGV